MCWNVCTASVTIRDIWLILKDVIQLLGSFIFLVAYDFDAVFLFLLIDTRYIFIMFCYSNSNSNEDNESKNYSGPLD